jgi:hypothetical protein
MLTVNWKQFGKYTKPAQQVEAMWEPVVVLTKLEPRSLIRRRNGKELWVENDKLVHNAFRRAVYLP